MQPHASSPRIEKCEALPEIQNKKKIQELQRRPSTSGISRLNDRIHLTYKWLRARVCEYELRAKTFSKVSEILLYSLRNLGIPASTVLYGSLATGLYLPESDIDIYLESPSPSCSAIDPLLVANILRSTGLYHNIFISGKEERTCVKFVDTDSNIRIDITFAAVSALSTVEYVMEFKSHCALLDVMVLILKYLINLKKLDRMNCPKGGISSYGLVLMVANFLKGHRPPPASSSEFDEFTSLTGTSYEGVDISKVNLVDLFSEFFDVYGNKLDLSKVALSATDGFVWKKFLEESMGLNPASSIFTLQDPVKLDNDVGYNVYLMGHIANFFAEMHRSILELKEGKAEQLQDCLLYRDLILTQSVEDYSPQEADLNSDGDSSSEDSLVDEERLVANQIRIPTSLYALRVQGAPTAVPVVDPCPIRCQTCSFNSPGIFMCPFEAGNLVQQNCPSSPFLSSLPSAEVIRTPPQTT